MTWRDISQRRLYKWQISTWKGNQYDLALRKCQKEATMRYHHTHITGTLALTSAVPVAGGDMKLVDLTWCWRKGEAVPGVGCGRTQCVHTCPQNPLISEQFHRQDFRVAHLLTYRQRPKSFLLMSMGALVIVLFQDLAVFLAFQVSLVWSSLDKSPKLPAWLPSILPSQSSATSPPTALTGF